MAKSRRKAREAALRALYEIEIGKRSTSDAVFDMLENEDLPKEQSDYAEKIVRGIEEHGKDIDERLASLVAEWDFTRIATVDRNVLRIAAYELFHQPGLPPAVTINEAIEIAKKYSTAESGKFVNGVLGRLLSDSPKANWDPSMAEEEAREEPAPAEEPEVVEETIREGDPEAKELEKIGLWRIRSKPEASED